MVNSSNSQSVSASMSNTSPHRQVRTLIAQSKMTTESSFLTLASPEGGAQILRGQRSGRSRRLHWRSLSLGQPFNASSTVAPTDDVFLQRKRPLSPVPLSAGKGASGFSNVPPPFHRSISYQDRVRIPDDTSSPLSSLSTVATPAAADEAEDCLLSSRHASLRLSRPDIAIEGPQAAAEEDIISLYSSSYGQQLPAKPTSIPPQSPYGRGNNNSKAIAAGAEVSYWSSDTVNSSQVSLNQRSYFDEDDDDDSLLGRDLDLDLDMDVDVDVGSEKEMHIDMPNRPLTPSQSIYTPSLAETTLRTPSTPYTALLTPTPSTYLNMLSGGMTSSSSNSSSSSSSSLCTKAEMVPKRKSIRLAFPFPKMAPPTAAAVGVNTMDKTSRLPLCNRRLSLSPSPSPSASASASPSASASASHSHSRSTPSSPITAVPGTNVSPATTTTTASASAPATRGTGAIPPSSSAPSRPRRPALRRVDHLQLNLNLNLALLRGIHSPPSLLSPASRATSPSPDPSPSTLPLPSSDACVVAKEAASTGGVEVSQSEGKTRTPRQREVSRGRSLWSWV